MGDVSQTEYLGKMRSIVVPRGPYNIFPVFADHAAGALVYDMDGREYIDFAGGIAVMNIGHSHPKVISAIKDQAERFTHTCWHVLMYEPYVKLADRLCALAPGAFHKMAIFMSTGAEAVENAVKIARFHTGRPGMIAFEHAFHGRTYMAMSLTSKIKPYKHGFSPLASEVHRLPYAYCYRCNFGLKYPQCDLLCADILRRQINSGTVDPDQIAGMIVEPVLGEGGFVVPPPGWLTRLEETCRENGIIFIVDEIQTGAGRTGKMFASEHFDLEPDMLTLAKSFAAGMPLSAVVGRKDILDSPGPGSLGGTYAGNPISCQAALAVLDVIQEENILARAERLGTRLKECCESWREEFEIIGDVRALGAMVAIELVRDRESKEPAAEETKALSRFCCENGVLVLPCGTHGNVIRLLMPLVIGDDDLERGLGVLGDGLSALQPGIESIPTAAG